MRPTITIFGESVSEAPVLQTERLLLRGWRDADREPFAAMNADPDVMTYFPATLTREDSDGMIDRAMTIWAKGGPCWWALEDPNGDFVGFTGLYCPTFQTHFTPCVEIGWRLAKEHWGKGYATEAASAAMDWGFRELGLGQIVSFTVPENQRSRRVMERLGMVRDPKDDWDHPRMSDFPHMIRHVLYRIDADQWIST